RGICTHGVESCAFFFLKQNFRRYLFPAPFRSPDDPMTRFPSVPEGPKDSITFKKIFCPSWFKFVREYLRLSGVAEHPLEVIFINDCGHGLLAVFIQTADHAASAIDQHVSVGAQDSRRKHDTKTDDGVYSKGGVHVEHHTSGGNVGSFSEVFAGVRCANCNRKLERKTYCAS